MTVFIHLNPFGCLPYTDPQKSINFIKKCVVTPHYTTGVEGSGHLTWQDWCLWGRWGAASAGEQVQSGEEEEGATWDFLTGQL